MSVDKWPLDSISRTVIHVWYLAWDVKLGVGHNIRPDYIKAQRVSVEGKWFQPRPDIYNGWIRRRFLDVSHTFLWVRICAPCAMSRCVQVVFTDWLAMMELFLMEFWNFLREISGKIQWISFSESVRNPALFEKALRVRDAWFILCWLKCCFYCCQEDDPVEVIFPLPVRGSR